VNVKGGWSGVALRRRVCLLRSQADIAWFPLGESDDVVSERGPGGLRDYDRSIRRHVAIEVWEAGAKLPPILLQALPAPALESTP
jgi:hypothetical protein